MVQYAQWSDLSQLGNTCTSPFNRWVGLRNPIHAPCAHRLCTAHAPRTLLPLPSLGMHSFPSFSDIVGV